jgi:hypothetical protein
MPNERGTLANKKAVAAAEMEPVTPVTAYPKDIYAMMSPARRKEAMTPNIVRRAIPVEEPVRRAEPVPRPGKFITIKPPQDYKPREYLMGPVESPDGKRAIKPGIRDYLDEVTSEENKDIDFSKRIKSYYASNPSFGDELAGKLSSDQAPAWGKFWDQLSSGNRAGAIVSANTSISAGNTIPESFFLNALQRDRIIREASRQDMEE